MQINPQARRIVHTKAWFGLVIQSSATSTPNPTQQDPSPQIRTIRHPAFSTASNPVLQIHAQIHLLLRNATRKLNPAMPSAIRQISFILSLYASTTVRMQGSASDARNSLAARQHARPPPCPPIQPAHSHARRETREPAKLIEEGDGHGDGLHNSEAADETRMPLQHWLEVADGDIGDDVV